MTKHQLANTLLILTTLLIVYALVRSWPIINKIIGANGSGYELGLSFEWLLPISLLLGGLAVLYRNSAVRR